MADLERHTIIRPLETSLGVGAGAPPVVTDDGLLLLFHERDGHEHYSTKRRCSTTRPARSCRCSTSRSCRPELDWERRGDVNEVVFVQGAVPQARRIDLLDLRRGRPQRRRRDRLDRRAARARCAPPPETRRSRRASTRRPGSRCARRARARRSSRRSRGRTARLRCRSRRGTSGAASGDELGEAPRHRSPRRRSRRPRPSRPPRSAAGRSRAAARRAPSRRPA